MANLEFKDGKIPFTQFVRPNGAQRPVWIERNEQVTSRAQKIINVGYHFTAEELSTGEIRFTCESQAMVDGAAEPDVPAMTLCRNNYEVVDAVDRLVKKAYEHLIKEGILNETII